MRYILIRPSGAIVPYTHDSEQKAIDAAMIKAGSPQLNDMDFEICELRPVARVTRQSPPIKVTRY